MCAALMPESPLEKKAIVVEEEKKVKEKEKEEVLAKEKTCKCDSNGFRTDEEVIGEITFEDNLQNQVNLFYLL